MATKSTYGFKGLPVPVGSVLYYAGLDTPFSFLDCAGQSILKSEYPALFSALGDAYGSVDALHFNLPNMTTNYPYIMGTNVFNPTFVPGSVDFPSVAVPLGAMPSLTSGNFAFQSWDLTANINNGNWFPANQNNQNATSIASDDAVKADSTDISNYSGSVTGGTIGYNNPPPAQQQIEPGLISADFLTPYVTFTPIIKAFDSFIDPNYEPLPVSTTNPFIVTPASQAFYPPNPESIYQYDPALSGFIF